MAPGQVILAALEALAAVFQYVPVRSVNAAAFHQPPQPTPF